MGESSADEGVSGTEQTTFSFLRRDVVHLASFVQEVTVTMRMTYTGIRWNRPHPLGYAPVTRIRQATAARLHSAMWFSLELPRGPRRENHIRASYARADNWRARGVHRAFAFYAQGGTEVDSLCGTPRPLI
jgi:hypothetical protein